MTNEQLQLGENGQTAHTQAPITFEATRINGLRNLILDLIQYSPVVSAQEWDTAVQRTANCQSPATLAKWYRNAVIEVANREESSVLNASPLTYATAQQKEEVIRLLNHPAITRRHKTRVLLGINCLKMAEARDLIATLTTYVAAPFGGGAVAASGQLANFPFAA